ncbi:hypothetical protein B0H19DRAFT_1134834 [Mycena capillaripes]|nr:hypothetical protein B0H19DRAFT_1134834 [Mycena capillaripes]
MCLLFAKLSLSTSAYLVVCRDWLRVATPLLYNVVVLRSRSQATALEIVLREHPEFGRFIKKLRVEGGYGMAMHTILKSAPNITDIFLSLAIWASDNTQGLCKGLPLINPQRVILVDPNLRIPLKNQNLAALRKVVLRCVSKWDLKILDFPYLTSYNYRHISLPEWMTRSADLVAALERSQTVHTVLLNSEFYDFYELPSFFLPLSKIPTVQVLQFKVQIGPGAKARIEADARLKQLVRYPRAPDSSSAEDHAQVPDIAPPLNPFFIPMESASEEIREFVWKRVLFFAMYVEELRCHSFPRGPSESYPSRLPILLVSKYFNRLALPYLYDSLNVTRNGVAAAMVQQLKDRPELGSFIRFIHFEWFFDADTIRTIFSYATNAQKYSANVNLAIPPDCFEVLAKTTGPSLRELAIQFRSSRIPTSMFTHFAELRVLTLWAPDVKFPPDSSLETALNKLHTLCIPDVRYDFSFFHAFSMMKLQSLHTLELGCILPDHDSTTSGEAVKFLNIHGGRLRHLTLRYQQVLLDFKVFDICRELVDVDLTGSYSLPPEVFTCETPHTSLTKIILDDNVFDNSAQIDPALFPALREIQIHDCEWPTTEREVSKSEWVPFAEAWLWHGIKLTDSAGQHWIPRVKRARGR